MTSPRPNILLIFTDQFRADCIGAAGNPLIKTPNLDRLHRSGTSFTRCYTPSPVCVPARHALTCGQPPHLTGCVDNVEIECHRNSFMDELNMLDYQTHGVGKMHFIKEKGDWGFQSRDCSEELEDDCEKDDYRDYLEENGLNHVLDPHGLRSEFYYLPQPSQLPDQHHNNAWVADRSIDFLNRRDIDRPFFLWSSFIKPHPPFESPVPWSRLYRMHEMDEPFRPDDMEDHQSFWNRVQNRYKYRDGGYDRHLSRMIRAAYYGVISHVDHHIGRILDALGPDIDNTLIVFSSDHGEMLGDYGCYGKRCMLDASARIPMIACLPGVFAANQTCDHPSSLLDLYPTFLEAAEPDRLPRSSEGIALQRLTGKEYKNRTVYSQFSQNALGLYMATNRDWKYIYSAADHKEWLFRNADESVNLSSDPACQSILQTLKADCLERFRSADYNSPIDEQEWRQFPSWNFPAENDSGLLFQDPKELKNSIANLGPHQHHGVNTQDESFKLLAQLADFSTKSAEMFENLPQSSEATLS